MDEKSQPTDIQNYYQDRSLFLTGVSGFLGKALLEKLLRSCPKIGTINVLIRPKSGFDPGSRLRTIFQSPIFDLLKSQNPGALNKVRAIGGDITLPHLGISEDDRRHLTETVSVVIHSAASVKFNEPIKVALNINYHGTARILELCHEMPLLTSFVHVSTAYSNCDLEHVPEKIVPSTVRPEDIDALSDEDAVKLTPALIGDKPNTYTFTKSLAENLLRKEGAQLPITIVRPSIIGAAWQEPQPGYVDSTCGVTGVMAASGKGFLTCMCGDGASVADVIPLDVTANLIIAAGYDIAQTRSLDIPVYNCCTGPVNPVTYGKIWDYTLEQYEEATPLNGVLRYPSLTFRVSLLRFHLINFLCTFLPCLAADTVAYLGGGKVKMMRAYRRLINSVVVYHYFASNQWSFESSNLERLNQRLSPADKNIFFTNVNEMEWRSYIRNYARGIKTWIFKEDANDVEEARKRMLRMYWIQKVLLMVTISILWSYAVRPLMFLFVSHV
ncbi:putative fatty acyl-CoA reductase CG5065 [Folsomia candida]|uniref:Fatty acyl-CoA reductase n=1 Tax=Folsomia candida TaxID=158441 RepID=A0A226D272_FOLCA|nr:putative fatty acyl-CoA reductase CG5065 [Folsomia candida]OXA38974.1 Fatty acyl-CoA reductase 1 [Folsomia candida]